MFRREHPDSELGYIVEDNLGIQKDYVFYTGNELSRTRNLQLALATRAEMLDIIGVPEREPVYNKRDQLSFAWAESEMIEYCKATGTLRGGLTSYDALDIQHTSVGFLKSQWWDDKVDMISDPDFPEIILTYWRYASPCGWIDPYIISDKQELLPLKKVLEGKARNFQVSGPYQFIYDCILFKEQDKHIEETPICQTGWSPLYGGLVRKCYESRTTFKQFYGVKGDGSKYDYTAEQEEQDSNRRIRIALHNCTDAEGCSVEEEINFSYFMSMFKFLIDHKGNVYITDHGEPSGHLRTCSDNSIRHFRAVLYHARRIGVGSVWELLRHVLINILSDDHFYIVDKGWRHAKNFINVELRTKHYAEVGFLLKMEDDLVVQDTVEGLTWLGAKLHDDGLCVYDVGKFLESAGYSLELDNNQYGHKLNSLLQLVCNDREKFEFLHDKAEDLCPNFIFTSIRDARALFNGWE